MKIGLFFGSFNPIHIGHLAIANFMSEFTDLNQVWMVVSPQNPFKSESSLMDARKRFALVKKAIGRNPKIKAVDLEFTLPQPSYTITTLKVLSKKFSQDKFVIIIGSDNLSTFYKWKDYKTILSEYELYVYPRSGFTRSKLKNHANVRIVKAPRMDVSSTFIREAIKKGKDVRYFVA